MPKQHQITVLRHQEFFLKNNLSSSKINHKYISLWIDKQIRDIIILKHANELTNQCFIMDVSVKSLHAVFDII